MHPTQRHLNISADLDGHRGSYWQNNHRKLILHPIDIDGYTFRQNVNKKTEVLNDTIDHMDFVDILRVFYPKGREHTFFSSRYGIFPRKHHMLKEKLKS